jgi:hypothetical protein
VRLAVLPAGAYLLLTPTVHPWYIAILLPWLPFLLPSETENPASHPIRRFVWPWLYLSCALAFSYLTYINPVEFHEYPLVRQAAYLPFFLLLLWAISPYLLTFLIRIIKSIRR